MRIAEWRRRPGSGWLPGLVLLGPAYEMLITACARSKLARLKMFSLEFRLQPVLGDVSEDRLKVALQQSEDRLKAELQQRKERGRPR